MIKIYAFWFVGLITLTLAGSLLLPLMENGGLGAIAPGKDFSYWLSLAQWDGGHYLEIVQKGYARDESFAFFPLYPILIKLLSFVTLGNELLAALIISNTAFLLFLNKLSDYVKDHFDKKRALNTVLTFLLFPTAFFGILAYSESLFLLLTILALEAISRKNLLKSGIFISLASLTRLIGVGLILSLASSIFFDYKNKFSLKSLSALIVSAFGILIFMIFSYFQTGDALKFIHVQALWFRALTNPITTLLNYFWPLATGQNRHLNDLLDFYLTVGFFVILILGRKKLSGPLWLFSMLALIIPVLSGTLTSMPRYLLASLGVFIIVGDYLEAKPALKGPLWSIMLALQALLVALFINGHWVA